ncbi:hypothetical protein PtB15_17B199 [Puccinia triticina]|nr:hypothetical protein PtB15_17B199 [Puccinia triticina]
MQGRLRPPSWTRALRRITSTAQGDAPATYQSKRYSPTTKLDQNQRNTPADAEAGEGHVSVLVRAGFIRQSSSGIWSFLPNGLRVLNKIQAIISHEMQRIGASEISMPLLQSQKLWDRSGRSNQAGPELFRLKDRKGSPLLLSPTHEEEVTNLVKTDIQSGKQLPIKLFHIGRKFRDEARPRAGLLRSREFIMKDLYTFDADVPAAMASYKQVQEAYRRIFETIGIPFTVAEADSGAIGGATSHEYHYKSSSGEDSLIHCTQCSYTANLELARSTLSPRVDDPSQLQVQFFSSPGTRRFLAAVLPATHELHPLKLSKACPDICPVQSSDDDTLPAFESQWERMEVLVDESCQAVEIEQIFERVTSQFRRCFPPPAQDSGGPLELSPLSIWPSLPTYTVHDLRTVSVGKPGSGPSSEPKAFEEHCPDCGSALDSSAAIEVGHTFYLGTKYSDALGLRVGGDGGPAKRAVEMGCFGIGISRLVGAIGLCNRPARPDGAAGLRWPLSVAPFKVCIIIPGGPDAARTLATANQLARLLDQAGIRDDVLIDDREQRIGWKLADAELVGYPILIILGNRWHTLRQVEIRNLLSASSLSIHTDPCYSLSAQAKGDQYTTDLSPVVSQTLAEIQKLTPSVS